MPNKVLSKEVKYTKTSSRLSIAKTNSRLPIELLFIIGILVI